MIKPNLKKMVNPIDNQIVATDSNLSVFVELRKKIIDSTVIAPQEVVKPTQPPQPLQWPFKKP